MEEKRLQVDLINRFERKGCLNNSNVGLYDSQATHGDKNYKSIHIDNQTANNNNNINNHEASRSPITNRKG